jgi:drug/metabolite transporter (DMT)-like permease
MSRTVLPRLQLLAAALLFSTGGAAIKATALSGWQVASFRSGVAALTIALLAPAARRAWSPRVVLVACCYATTMICFVVANKLTTAANSIFLQSTAPLYIMLASPWLLHERVRGRDVLLMVVVGAGLLPVLLGTDSASATAPDPARGNLVALASGVAWAATVMGIRSLATASAAGPFATVLLGNLIAFLVCLPLALPAAAGPRDWAVIGYLGVFQIGAAYLCLSSAVRHVGALEASIILLAEPALNPLWAWLLHGERPSGWALAGGVVILGATLAKAWWDSLPASGRGVGAARGATGPSGA